MSVFLKAVIAIVSVIGGMMIFSVGVVVIAVISLVVVVLVIVNGLRRPDFAATFQREKPQAKPDSKPNPLIIDAEYEVIEEKKSARE